MQDDEIMEWPDRTVTIPLKTSDVNQRFLDEFFDPKFDRRLHVPHYPPRPDTPEAWLAEISYRPGWRARIIEPMDWARTAYNEGGVLTIEALVEDTYGKRPGLNRVVVHRFTIPPRVIDNRDRFIRFVFERLQEVELHECGEWFVVDGKRPFDPHKNGAR